MSSFPSNKRSRVYSTEKNNWVEDTLQPETKFNNMIDPSTWVVGSTGDQTGFTQYGLTSENSIIEGFGPSKVKIPLWDCLPTSDSGNWDGGFIADAVAYDPSKAYRFSCFYKRTGTTDGGTRLGMKTDGLPDAYTLAGADDDAPYFIFDSNKINSGFVLMVGYLFPHAYAGISNRGGEYLLVDGSKDSTATSAKKSNSAATTIQAVIGFNRSSTTTNNLKLARPRIDLIDGTEPPLALMLAHTATFTADYTDDVITGSDGSENKMYVQTTQPSLSIGDYWIDYSTGENRVFWRNDSGKVVELAPYFSTHDPRAPSGIKIESNDAVYSSLAQSGKRQLRSSGPQRYEATVTFPPATMREFAKTDSFLSYIQNTVAPFYLTLPIKRGLSTAEAGNITVNGANQTGNTLNISSDLADEIAIIADGQYFTIGGSDKIYMSVGDVATDGSGDGIITITPRLQFTPVDTAHIQTVNPEMKVNLVKVHKFAVKPPELYSYEIDVEEVIE